MTNEPSLLVESEPVTTPWAGVVVLAIAVATLAGIAVAAFAWPATHSTPHDIQLALAGPDAAVASVTAALDQQSPGTFDFSTAPSADAARTLVARGDVDGALVLAADAAPEAVIATQASPATAQVITGAANAIAARQAAKSGATPATTATVTDVSPLTSGDPRGSGIPAAMLPLFLAGLAAGAIALFLVRGTRQRLAVALGGPLLAGGAITLVIHTWLDALGGAFLAQWGAVALGAAAIAMTVLGLSAIMGRAGLGVAALTILLLGNPFSAAATGTDFVPAGWSAIGQALPPGAAATTMRDIAAFGTVGLSVWILAAWVIGGLALVGVGAARTRRLKV